MKCSKGYNINDIFQQRCTINEPTHCKSCETCILTQRINQTSAWFIPLSYTRKKEFLLRLISSCRNIKSVLDSVFKNLCSKDFQYCKSRIISEKCYMDSTDHSLDVAQITNLMYNDYFQWFIKSSELTKRNYLFFVLQLCESHLLSAIRERLGDLTTSSSSGESEDEILYSEINNNIPEEDSFFIHTFQSEPLFQSKSVLRKRKSPKRKSCSAKERVVFSDGFSNELFHRTGRSERLSSRFSRTLSSNSSKVHFVKSSGSSARCTPVSYLPTRPLDSAMSDGSSSNNRGHHGGDFYRNDKLLFVDFIKILPVHISKKVLGYLDEQELEVASKVSMQWEILAREVKSELILVQVAREDVMIMQAASSKIPNPTYARQVPVHIPKLTKDGSLITNNEAKHIDVEELKNEFQDLNMEQCYEGLETRTVELDERNVYCSSYNILVVEPHKDAHRCIHYDHGHTVAIGSLDRKIRLVDTETGNCFNHVSGHTGSIKCVHLDEKNNHLISGSFDLTVRVWNVDTGKCKFLFRGHKGTIVFVTADNSFVVSSSTDKTVRDFHGVNHSYKENIFQQAVPVTKLRMKTSDGYDREFKVTFKQMEHINVLFWNILSGRCKRVFKHDQVVRYVEVQKNTLMSGCVVGTIFIWDIEDGIVTKTLKYHHDVITGIRFTQYHILSSSFDCYVVLWSNMADITKPLTKFRHPKEVLCLDTSHCRLITGCSDGKIRVWNMLSGECLRVIRGNSKNDAISSIIASKKRLVVNTLSCVLVYNFEDVKWDYMAGREKLNNIAKSFVKRVEHSQQHSTIRARKVLIHGSPIHQKSRDICRDLHDVSGVKLEIPRVMSAPIHSRTSSSFLKQTNNGIEKHIRRIRSANFRSNLDENHCQIEELPHLNSNINSRAENTSLNSSLHFGLSLYNQDPNISKKPKSALRCQSAPSQCHVPNKKELKTSSCSFASLPQNKMIPKRNTWLKRPATVYLGKQVGNTDLEDIKIRTYYSQLEFEERLKSTN